MRIAAIEHYVPEHVVPFEKTMELFHRHSAPYHSADSLRELLEAVAKTLTRMGHRELRLRAEGEPWLERYLERTRSMIASSGVALEEIDKVIYVATARGYREPAMAYSLANHLGIRGAECFDILDACSGWGRAANLLEPHFMTGRARHALVLSLEFNRDPGQRHWAGSEEGGYHSVYSIRDPSELDWRVFGASVGEAGTATLFSADGGEPWYIDYVTDTTQYQCCGFYLRNHEDFDILPIPVTPHDGEEEAFFSFGHQIGKAVHEQLVALLRKPELESHLREAKLAIPHSLSKGLYEKIFEAVGIAEKGFHPFEDHGNVVSSGVPLALSLAAAQGRIERGDRVVMAPSGAGNSYGVLSFVY